MSDLKGPSNTSTAAPAGQAILNNTRVFGQSHWMNTASELQFLTRSLIIPSTRNPENAVLESVRRDARALLQRCKILARELKQDRPRRTCDVLAHNDSQPLPRHIADEAINMYVSCFELVFRMLHIPTLREEYETY